MDIHSQEKREHVARRRRRGAIVAILDAGVDIAQRQQLSFFKHSEQSAKQIAGIVVVGIERHRSLLFHLEIVDKHGFDDRDAQRVHVVIGAQTHQNR